MSGVLLAGAVAGLGLLIVVTTLLAGGQSGAVALGKLDLDRRRLQRDGSITVDQRAGGPESRGRRRVGAALADALAQRGLALDGVRADLAVLGRSLESHLALTLATTAMGLLVPVVLTVVLAATGLTRVAVAVPVVAVLIGGALGLLLPSSQVRGRALARRRDFRHTVGAFLDLVALNLAGGRGVPEALATAATVGDGWALQRISGSLENARRRGITPWAALGTLGERLGVAELAELAGALALVAEDGAKVRDSLAARAATLRRRELADLEGKAQQRSQSMLVAQLLLCAGFLVFLIYPAIANVVASQALR